MALQAIESGVDKLRINPGNIGGEDRVKAVVMAAKEKAYSNQNWRKFRFIRKHILEKYGYSYSMKVLIESAMGSCCYT